MSDRKLLKEVSEAIREALNCWEQPDSPEAFCYAMKHIANLAERIESMRQLSNPDRSRRVVPVKQHPAAGGRV